MKKSDKCIVNIPSPLPKPYDKFQQEWINWAKSNNQKQVTLVRSSVMIGGAQKNQGWKVSSEIVAPMIPGSGAWVSSWLPNKWLSPTTDQNAANITSTTICDCPSQKLWQQGCQGH